MHNYMALSILGLDFMDYKITIQCKTKPLKLKFS